MSRGLYIKEKHSFNFKGISFWLVLVSLFGLYGWFGYRFYTTGETPPIPVPIASAVSNPTANESVVDDLAKKNHRVPSSYPRYISIKSLNIDNARVFSMGINKNGELDTPAGIFDAGWYQDSSLPGDKDGALLIDGHNGGPTKDGIFKRLPDMSIGDEIVIERGDGKKFNYRVKEVGIVSLESLNNGGMNKLMKSFDKTTQGLNIISCTGNWIPAKQTYDNRAVVRAILSN